jgi:RimJ/RimL family protein N-acetyltransferase
MTIIETPRLRLRPGHEGDINGLVDGLNDWSVAQWLIMPPYPYSREDAAAFIGWSHDARDDGFGHRIIADRQSDRLLGCVGLFNEDGARWDLGYWIARHCRRQGFATEALQGLLAHAFAHGARLAAICAYPDPHNTASCAMLEKLGFLSKGSCTMEKPNKLGRAESRIYELTRVGFHATGG